MGFFKKIFKGIGKIWKAIGKRIKKAFKKIGKWFGKLGVFGQIALSFIPGIGPMLGGLFKGLGQGALAILKKGLTATGLGGKIVKGATWLVDTARKVVGGIQEGFKTVTSGATSFVKNTGKWLGKKMGMDITTAPTKFFGQGGDSVLGRVGAEVTNNFAEFKNTVGEIFAGPENRAKMIQRELDVTKIGGVEVNVKELDKQLKSMPSDPNAAQALIDEHTKLLGDITDGIQANYGSTSAARFTTLSNRMLEYGKMTGSPNPFGDTLKFVAQEQDYVSSLFTAPEEQFEKWNKIYTDPEGIKGAVDPFQHKLTTNIATSTDTAPAGQADKPSLLGRGFDQVKTSFREGVSDLPRQFISSTGTQMLSNLAGFGPDYSSFEQPQPPKAVDFYKNQFVAFRGSTPQLESAPYGLMDTSYSSGTESYIPQISNLMYPDGVAGGMYGAFTLPGFNYGMPQQQKA